VHYALWATFDEAQLLAGCPWAGRPPVKAGEPCSMLATVADSGVLAAQKGGSVSGSTTTRWVTILVVGADGSSLEQLPMVARFYRRGTPVSGSAGGCWCSWLGQRAPRGKGEACGGGRWSSRRLEAVGGADELMDTAVALEALPGTTARLEDEGTRLL
jgi:hypothetical protein